MRNLICVREKPWSNLSKTLEDDGTLNDSSTLIKKCNLDWEVYKANMKTDVHGIVPGYHAIYRKEDDNRILGVANFSGQPKLVQNVDMFNMVGDLLSNGTISFETAGSLYGGKKVFGCFKITRDMKIQDDKVDSYILVVNDHLKPDGKITIMNTPVRVVCQNMMTHALNTSRWAYRVPCTDDASINKDLAHSIYESSEDAMIILKRRTDKFLDIKLNRDHVEKIIDEIFPMTCDNTGEPLDTKANEHVSEMRSVFVEDCMMADDLANYRGTAYQIYNAITDFNQHYFSNASKAYDLDARMSIVPGIGQSTDINRMGKFMKIVTKIAA